MFTCADTFSVIYYLAVCLCKSPHWTPGATGTATISGMKTKPYSWMLAFPAGK